MKFNWLEYFDGAASLLVSSRLTPLCSVLQLVGGIPVVLLTGLSCGQRNIATDNLVRLDLVRWSYVLKKAWNLTSYFVLLSVFNIIWDIEVIGTLLLIESQWNLDFFRRFEKSENWDPTFLFAPPVFRCPCFALDSADFLCIRKAFDLLIWRSGDVPQNTFLFLLFFSEIRKFGKVRSYNLNTLNTNTNNAAIILLNLQVRMKECPRQEFNLKKNSRYLRISIWLSKWTN